MLVAENGYLNHADGHKTYALAIHGHNGSGWYPMFDDDRFQLLGTEPQPWIERDGIDLICGQRGIGSREMASPPNWHVLAAKRIPQPDHCRVRLHPGNLPAKTTVEEDLAAARRCIIWSSSSGVKALVMGIPVRYDAPHWICFAAGTRLVDPKDCRDDALRSYALQCMANAQYTIEEIESGFPFVTFRDACEEATW